MTTNEERANRVGQLLEAFRNAHGDSGTSAEEDVIDFLTDLRHFCDRTELNLGDLDRIAHGHYLAGLDEVPLPLLPGL